MSKKWGGGHLVLPLSQQLAYFMTSKHIQGNIDMGDRILVSALFMKKTLKNKIGEIGKKVSDIGRKQLVMRRYKKRNLRNMIILQVDITVGNICICKMCVYPHMHTCIHTYTPAYTYACVFMCMWVYTLYMQICVQLREHSESRVLDIC